MKKILITVSFILICIIGFGQQNFIFFNTNASKTNKINKEPKRTIDDQGINGIEIEYQFQGASVFNKINNEIVYQTLYINNFSMTEEVGKPALPCHTDIIAIPVNATTNIKIISYEIKKYNNYLIYPALKPALDKVGAPNPEFEIDNEFYSKDCLYPANPIEIAEIQKIRGAEMAMVKIYPIQYNPKKRELTVYSKIRYKIEFSGGDFFINPKEHTSHFLNLFSNIMLNNKEIDKVKNNLKSQTNTNTAVKDYIIITQDNYLEAADSLARWKEQMGYSVEIISKNSWYSSLVKTEIQNRYNSWTPKPDFVVFIGDHQTVPGQIITNSMGDDFATDLYYTCMDGGNDYYPDMARGRISANSPAQALMIVKKIINYEKNPVSNPLFYKNGLNAAYFQDDDLNGYADRRFAQTSEDIRNYMVNYQSYNVTRVYKTASNVNPMYWNNGTYANGEAIPDYLKKPTFPWTGSYTEINNTINSTNGVSYVFHRDHGYELGWGDPSYTTSNIPALNNPNNLPVVFSVNCLTGKYLETECFAEKFLRHPNGGTAGIFAHAEVSYSGYNDGLSLGMVDAIWSNPGLIPNFTGNGDNPQGTPVAHTPIYTLGDVGNQGLIRMVQTWGNNKYTFELLHYFGDPSMQIWTANPTNITASHSNSVNCHNDTSLTITNSSCPDAVATLVANGELIGKVQLINGNGIIYFSSIYGNNATLTLSKHNYKPYITNIVINGGCVNSKFSISSGKSCIMDSISFINQSTGNIVSYNWNFGNNAIPSFSNLSQPGKITYLTSGLKTISLILTDINNTTYTFSKNLNIAPFCKYTIPETTLDSSNACSGLLYDNGGEGDYSNNSNGLFIIRIPGAISISLNFNSFDIEASDAIIVYDGDNISAPILGYYNGSNIPNINGITSSSNVICIKQLSNATITKSGFEAYWHCNMPSAPIADFKTSDTSSCDGNIAFTDLSINLPMQWYWDFGDGYTSNQQHPIHEYKVNGYYTVKLKTINSFGQDSIIKSNIISIYRPSEPIISGITENCGPHAFTINAAANGNILWFNSPTSNIAINSGNTLNTAVLTSDTSFYIESQTFNTSKYGAKTDSSGLGNYFNNTNIHYLVFNCTTPALLKSVKVYAATSGNRTINLRSNTGSIIASKTVMIPQGTSRVILNFNIPVQNNLQLEGSASPNLYRNSSGCNYPYQIGNSISIIKCSATQSPTGYYYFFYDWEIQDEICKSNRLTVDLHVNNHKPISGFSSTGNNLEVNFSNQTIDGNSYLWNFGDGSISTSTNPTHIYSNYGNYNLKLISYNACGTDSITSSIGIYMGINQNTNDNISIYPNPTYNSFIIKTINEGEIENIKIYNTEGLLIYNKIPEKNDKFKPLIINLSNYAKGIYYLYITNQSKTIVKKIIKL